MRYYVRKGFSVFYFFLLLLCFSPFQNQLEVSYSLSAQSFPSIQQRGSLNQNKSTPTTPEPEVPLLTKSTFSLPIALYHSLSETPSTNAYVVTVEEFRSDLDYIKESGYTPVHMSQVIDFVYYGGDLPEKPMIISWDDGYSDNFSLMYPIIEEYQMKVVVSLVTSALDSEVYYWQLPFLTSQEVQGMADSGLVEFQCHSYDLHFSDGRTGSLRLPMETIQEYGVLFEEDLQQSKDMFHQLGLTPATTYSYPGGLMNWENSIFVENQYISSFVTFPYEANRVTRGEGNLLYNLTRLNRDTGVSTQDYFQELFSYSNRLVYF